MAPQLWNFSYKEVKMKRLNQAKVAEELGISKSYLSMILLGQRKCPIGLMERLQAIPGVHKVVDNQLWDRLCKQEVRGSNPLSSTMPSCHLEDV